MSASEIPLGRGQRRASKPAKQATPSTDSGLSRASSRSPSSPTQAPGAGPNKFNLPQTDADTLGGRKRKSTGPKRGQNGVKQERESLHRHRPSQPELVSSDRYQATPLKQAYAGPTFHASPDASSLPLPSFYSKSLPPKSSTKVVNGINQQAILAERRTEADCSITPKTSELKLQRPSPLEFLFEAARQARETPRVNSTGNPPANSSPHDTNSLHRARSPREGTAETVFPFELEASAAQVRAIGPSFATAYKERMNAFGDNRLPISLPTEDLGEEERRAKTDALKRLLMNAQSPHSTSASARTTDTNNGHNLEGPQPSYSNSNPPHPQKSHYSSPSTPVAIHRHSPLSVPQHDSHAHSDLRLNGSPIHRSASSNLRREFQPSSEPDPAELSSDIVISPLISTARQPLVNHQTSRPTYSTNTSKSIYSPQKLEHDLRRALKLDITSGG